MGQYLLIRGSHSVTTLDEEGNPVPHTYRAREAGNNVVEDSKTNLAKKWPEKFKELSDPQALAAAQAQIQTAAAQRRSMTDEETNAAKADREKAAYEGMSFEELQRHAREEHVDLTGVKKNDKEEVIKRLLAQDAAKGA